MSRYTLTRAQWKSVAPLLPGKQGDPGRSGVDNRRTLEGILWGSARARPGGTYPKSSATGTRSISASAAGPIGECSSASTGSPNWTRSRTFELRFRLVS